MTYLVEHHHNSSERSVLEKVASGPLATNSSAFYNLSKFEEIVVDNMRE